MTTLSQPERRRRRARGLRFRFLFTGILTATSMSGCCGQVGRPQRAFDRKLWSFGQYTNRANQPGSAVRLSFEAGFPDYRLSRPALRRFLLSGPLHPSTAEVQRFMRGLAKAIAKLPPRMRSKARGATASYWVYSDQKRFGGPQHGFNCAAINFVHVFAVIGGRVVASQSLEWQISQ